VVILLKGTIGWVDAVVLLGLYGAYLWVLFQHPPHSSENLAEAPAVSRWAYRQRGWRRPAAIGGLFALGGALLFVTAHPFLESMLALAATFGVSQFVLVQWVAPFLSEFPEKLSAFQWARRVTHAPMAMMNMLSSNINQWTVLAAMIPLVFGYSHWHHTGAWTAFAFDGAQRLEILITLLQSVLATMLLLELEFSWGEATGIFLLWVVQFLMPSLRSEVAAGYALWIILLIVQYGMGDRKAVALTEFWRTLRTARS
jgi:cation:H+ antiporter